MYLYMMEMKKLYTYEYICIYFTVLHLQVNQSISLFAF